MNEMNDFEKIARENCGRHLDKWRHYFEVYDRHFSRFRGNNVHVLEIGVGQGGSLQMWKSYFGARAQVYGVDVNPKCGRLEEERIKIFIGDQGNREFLKALADKIPKIDILIDDGGHKMEQQIITFNELFPRVDKNGVYLCEDLHTSYWSEWGGGYLRNGTFIEHSKRLIDQLNAWQFSGKSTHLQSTEFTQSAYSMHYYNSVLVIEKRMMEPPSRVQTGAVFLR